MAWSSTMIRTSAVVPTLGHSPWLAECLTALQRAGGRELEIVLVAQGPAGRAAAERVATSCDRVLLRERNLGFAAANNLGLSVARGDYVATVNDDVVVDDGWHAALLAALDADPRLAAAQGVNLLLGEREDRRSALVDGCGLAWNRWLQAVQIGREGRALAEEAPPRRVFGVSATAALYRRESLAAQPLFDAELFAYYEDVDLACRLRVAGHDALLVPAARARHAGSISGRRLSLGGWPWIYGNRHLVLARHLGRDYTRLLPRIGARDVVDLFRSGRRLDLGRMAGIVAGWGRAVRRLRRYTHRRAPAIDLAPWIGAPELNGSG